MPEFHEIDLDTWNRREHYLHYRHRVPCAFSLTAPLDVTALRAQLPQGSGCFYAAMIHVLSWAVNAVPAFRTVERGGRPGYWQQSHPSYTIFHRESETFSSLWTEYSGDFPSFLQRFQEDRRMYGRSLAFSPKPGEPENVFYVSALPWTSFTSFHVSLSVENGLIPIFTLGRYREENGRVLLPLALQAHHASCDGFHAAKLLDICRQRLDGCRDWL